MAGHACCRILIDLGLLPIEDVPHLLKTAREVLPAFDLVLKCLQEALASSAGPWDGDLGWLLCSRLRAVRPAALPLSLLFYFAPRSGCKILVKLYILIFLLRWWKTCAITPLSPRGPNHNELGSWGLGWDPVNCHDGVLLEELRRIALVGPLIELSTPGEQPEVMKLRIMPQSSRSLWKWFVGGLTRCMLLHTVVETRHMPETAHFPVAAVITAGRGHDPGRALPIPLLVAFYSLFGTLSGNVRRCIPIAAGGRLPARLYRAEHDRLVASGVSGGDAVWLLERAFEEVTLSALPWALFVVTRQRAWVALVSLATNLRLVVPSLLLP
jgi:hypothetical protein